MLRNRAQIAQLDHRRKLQRRKLGVADLLLEDRAMALVRAAQQVTDLLLQPITRHAVGIEGPHLAHGPSPFGAPAATERSRTGPRPPGIRAHPPSAAARARRPRYPAPPPPPPPRPGR